jgi:uncharacterized protein (TIGR00297 family)
MVMRLLLAALLAVAMSVRGYRKRSLNKSGSLLALVVGFVSCAASITLGLTLIAFFLGSSRVTKVGAAKKRKIEDGHQEGGNRNWVQVLANGGLGTCLAAAFWAQTAGGAPEQPLDFAARPVESWLQAAYMCHYACCNADTWASELGVLSASAPILITRPWRTVPTGTNGGVTWVGTAASLGGGLLIGVVFFGLGTALQPTALRHASTTTAQWPLVLLGAAAGVVGSLVDSLLGATLQYSGWCEEKKLVVEKPTPGLRHISGFHVLDNHMVNFLAAAATSGLGALAASFVW